MESVVEWFLANWWLALLIAHAVASAITRLTPTPRDDEILGQIYKAVETIALVTGHAKELPPNRVRR